MPASATSAHGLIHVSGVRARPSARGHDMAGQTRDVLDQLAGRLVEAGSGLDQAVSVHVHLCRVADFAAMNAAYAPVFGVVVPPARTTVVVRAFEEDDALVEMSAVAVPAGHSREALHPADWKPSVNPYSYGIRTGDAVLASVEDQARSAVGRLESCLHDAGLGWEDAVEVVIHVTDEALVPRARRAVRQAIGRDLPAGCCLVTALTVTDAHVEITVTAAAR